MAPPPALDRTSKTTVNQKRVAQENHETLATEEPQTEKMED